MFGFVFSIFGFVVCWICGVLDFVIVGFCDFGCLVDLGFVFVLQTSKRNR